MEEGFSEDLQVSYLGSFYHGGEEAVREEVPLVDEGVKCLMLVGHNPTWEYLVHSLSGEEIVMKTATAALLTRDLPDWGSAFDGGRWHLEKVLYPREL